MRVVNRLSLAQVEGVWRLNIWLFLLLLPFMALADERPESDIEFRVFPSCTLPVFVETKSALKNPTDISTPPYQIVQTSFNLYKKIVAPYWGWHCQFEPSCSEFCLKSIETHGFLLGIMMTTDRLSRDHNMIQNEWYGSGKKGRYADPVLKKSDSQNF